MIKIVNEFFDTNAFAQQAILMNVSGSGVTKPILVIFNAEGYSSVVNNISYSTDKPEAVCISSDVEDTRMGSLLKVDGVWYNVTDKLNDGTGVCTLTLSRDRIHG